MFRVMARRPREKFTYEDLQEKAGIVVEDRQISVYFSRFRQALKNGLKPNGTASTKSTPPRQIDRLIKHHRKRGGIEAGYSLDIDPRLVRILS